MRVLHKMMTEFQSVDPPSKEWSHIINRWNIQQQSVKVAAQWNTYIRYIGFASHLTVIPVVTHKDEVSGHWLLRAVGILICLT